ncbi:hypothetical protein LLEC1_04767 [Akanthomyces lecanii]|uniref:Protein kinase domain-containing protein n=1 Tax=Cordyceps confragosa TaxID=2714763 RepID=A0A179I200_CORDF|nr:hypothetical protein LLEC1_04767 [Akanthomyces lecanii]
MNESPRKTQFRFRGTTITAEADPFDHIHSNVLRLAIIRTPFQKYVATILNWLPRCIGQLFLWPPPEYLLPNQVVLKTRKTGWDDEFENEKAMYKRLEPLQGCILPRFLGDADHGGSPAIVLSHIDSVRVYERQSSPMPVDEFERQLEAAFREFTRFGVVYGDAKLDNCLISEGRVMLVDLEAVSEEKEEDYELAITSYCNKIVREYRLTNEA